MRHRYMSQKDRAYRRRVAADMIRSGVDRRKVMEDLDISEGVLTTACREHGVSLPKINSVASHQSFVILKRLIDGEKQEAVAKSLGISQQRVQQISKQAEEAGFDLPCHKYPANRG